MKPACTDLSAKGRAHGLASTAARPSVGCVSTWRAPTWWTPSIRWSSLKLRSSRAFTSTRRWFARTCCAARTPQATATTRATRRTGRRSSATRCRGRRLSYEDPPPETLPIKGYLSFDAARADVLAELPAYAGRSDCGREAWRRSLRLRQRRLRLRTFSLFRHTATVSSA